MMVMLSVLLGTALVVVILLVFASSIGNSGASTQVTSTGTTLINLLPWIGAMIAGGLFMVAISRR